MSGTAATIDRACAACLRRAWLLGALVAHFERCSPRRSDLSGLLALPDGDLIRALGGRDVPVLRDRYRGFSPSTLRSTLAAFALHVVCRHDPAYPPQLAEAPDRPAALFVAGAWERFAALVAAPSIALVGARRASGYGLEAGRVLGRELAAAGVAASRPGRALRALQPAAQRPVGPARASGRRSHPRPRRP